MATEPARVPKAQCTAPPLHTDASFADALQALDDRPLTMTVSKQSANIPSTLVAIDADKASETILQTSSTPSLSMILSQSLRTDDTALLETCFEIRDLNVVRLSIERLDTPAAGTLLLRLAERLSARPARAGSLLVWIQWILVAHGGRLSRQADLENVLSSLYQIVQQRAKGLTSLLTLKGKLDLLEAQLNLRTRLRTEGFGPKNSQHSIIYVEGQNDEKELETSSTTDEEGHTSAGNDNSGFSKLVPAESPDDSESSSSDSSSLSDDEG